MSVISFKEIHDGRGGGSGGIDDAASTRCWRVVTDNKYDDDTTILIYGLTNGILPNLYQPHPSNGYLTARRITADNQGDSPFHWIAKCEYSSKPLSEKEKEKEDHVNPTERPAVVGPWQTSMYTEAVEEDINGKAVVNSAGDYFDPPPEVDRPRWSCSVSKCVPSVPAWVTELDAPINSEEFTLGGLTIGKGKARVIQITISDKKSENGFEFYEFAMSIEFRKKGYRGKYLDQGFRRKKDPYSSTESDAKRYHIMIEDDDGEKSKVSSPVLLNGYGQRLDDPKPSTAKYMEYDVIESMDFNDLPLT